MCKCVNCKEMEREIVRLKDNMETKCWFCGGKLIWQSDFMPEDFGFDEDTAGLVSILLCSECGAEWQGMIIEGEED